MRSVRVVFTLALFSGGFVPIPSPRTTWLGPNEGLAARLRQQGRDPRLYMIWEGSPLHVAQSEFIDSRGVRFEVVKLVQAVVDIPGDGVERYILFDERGALQHAATLHWPSRQLFDIRSDRCFGDPSEGYLDIRDSLFMRRSDVIPAPYVELGIEPGRSRRVSLSWTGTPRLGRVWIENRRFNAERARD